MEKEKVWLEFAALPPDAQYQVIEFIAFLQTRYNHDRTTKNSYGIPLIDEPFIGMWKNREDMQDSKAYVRKLREHEWSVKHE